MKWPRRLRIVRHAQSAYNVLRDKKKGDEQYERFLQLYELNHSDDREFLQLATVLKTRYALGVGDYETPITEAGRLMAVQLGAALSDSRPDVIFVSPYLRTRQTYEAMCEGGYNSHGAKMVIDDRIREQEHGLSLLYNDWRLFHAFHPEQRALRELLGPYWYRYPQGESVSDVRDRIRAFLGMLVRECDGLEVHLVSHHLTKLSMLANQLRWSPEEFIKYDEKNKPINCGVTTFTGDPMQGEDGRMILETYNENLLEVPAAA